MTLKEKNMASGKYNTPMVKSSGHATITMEPPRSMGTLLLQWHTQIESKLSLRKNYIKGLGKSNKKIQSNNKKNRTKSIPRDYTRTSKLSNIHKSYLITLLKK
jgi:hypothetical protein